MPFLINLTKKIIRILMHWILIFIKICQGICQSSVNIQIKDIWLLYQYRQVFWLSYGKNYITIALLLRKLCSFVSRVFKTCQPFKNMIAILYIYNRSSRPYTPLLIFHTDGLGVPWAPRILHTLFRCPLACSISLQNRFLIGFVLLWTMLV